MVSCRSIVGITGGVGSGKSVVSRIVRLNGFPVYDCDIEAKRIMQDDMTVREKLCRTVGKGVYGPDGRLDRAYMARCIFSDPGKRNDVNGIVHRAVLDDFLRFYEDSPGRMVFCESAILATSGFDRHCDFILMVDAPEPLRIERVVARSGMQREEVKRRIEAQKEETGKLPQRKTLVIENDGVHAVLPEVLNFISKNITKTEITCSEKFWL